MLWVMNILNMSRNTALRKTTRLGLAGNSEFRKTGKACMLFFIVNRILDTFLYLEWINQLWVMITLPKLKSTQARLIAQRVLEANLVFRQTELTR